MLQWNINDYTYENVLWKQDCQNDSIKKFTVVKNMLSVFQKVQRVAESVIDYKIQKCWKGQIKFETKDFFPSVNKTKNIH